MRHCRISLHRWPIVVAASLMLCAGACAPVEQAAKPERITPQIADGHFKAADGEQLPLRSWVPEGKPRAVIIALHGMNDYSNAFAGAGEFFREKGIAMFAYDQRGFGANKDAIGIWGGQENLTSDLHEMTAAARTQYPDTPVYLLGESMGGAVVINSMSEADAAAVDGVILSAPAVWGDETMNGFYRVTLWLMAHTFPASQFTGEDMEILASDNIPMLIALGQDPLVIKKTRVDAMYGIVSLMDSAYRSIDKVKVPVLMLYGAHDQVIPKMSVSGAIERIEAPYTVAYYPDGYHMLLRDLKGQVVLDDIVSWIDDRYRPLPSGYDLGWRDDMMIGDTARVQRLSDNKIQ